MKFTNLQKMILVAAIGIFSQFAIAQNDANAAAVKEVADIVAGLNHFPSEDDLEALDAIIANSALAQGIRDMANAVASIEHSATEEAEEQWNLSKLMRRCQKEPKYSLELSPI